MFFMYAFIHGANSEFTLLVVLVDVFKQTHAATTNNGPTSKQHVQTKSLHHTTPYHTTPRPLNSRHTPRTTQVPHRTRTRV
jgi:hypothetical protein